MKRRKQMTRRKSGRGRRNSNFTFGKILLAVGVPALVLGGGVLAMQKLSGIESADAQYCFNRDDQKQIAVLVDNSLRDLTAIQTRDYRTGMMREFDRAPVNARIMFFTTALDAQGSLARPFFTVCKPAGTAMEREKIGAPSKPGPYLKRQVADARALYEKAVDDVIAATQDDGRIAKDSPILELVQAVSKYDGFQSQSRSLALITDGIQNNETAQFCITKNHMPPYEIFARRGSYQTIKPKPLSGVDVTLLIVEQGSLPRLQVPYCSHRELRTWWTAFFTGNAAASVDLHRLRAGVGL